MNTTGTDTHHDQRTRIVERGRPRGKQARLRALQRVLTPNLLSKWTAAGDNNKMRRVLILPTILALFLAFLMAPYQHVHVHSPGGHADEPDQDHHDHDDDATVVHIHFYSFAVPNDPNGRRLIGEGGHVAIPLDTFATLSYVAVPTLVKPQSQMLLFPPRESIAEIVRVVEPRGHDPPDLDFSPPRAPPA